MLIIGAGMSGLLAGQYFRSLNPTIIERQDSLPNNHSALLRFRSDSVSNLTGINFQEVTVQKAIYYKRHFCSPSILMNNLYSRKVTGEIHPRSISNLDTCNRYIAPTDFIQKVSNGLNARYGEDAKAYLATSDAGPIISTMPVFALAKMLDYDLNIELEHKSIWTTTITVPDCDVYQTIYFPDEDFPYYRISITGDTIIAESIKCPSLESGLDESIMECFGIDVEGLEVWMKKQKYGKLIEHSGKEVKDFIIHATNEHNIYSLGRWGTHRQILMDDVVHDLKVIGHLINTNKYGR